MFFVCVSCFQDYRPDFFKNTESITNRADIDQKFYEIGKLPEDYADVRDFLKGHKSEGFFEKDSGLSKYKDELKDISVKIVNNLVDILKIDQQMTDSRLTESVCEIVDNVDNGRKTLDTIYGRSSRYEKMASL